MEKLLSKIYDLVVFNEKDSIRYGTEFEVFIQELLEPLEKNMSEEELETVRETIYVTAREAERYGFKLGARFMAKLLQEVFEMPE